MKIKPLQETAGTIGYLCEVRLKNTGATPATNVELRVNRSEARQIHAADFYLKDNEPKPGNKLTKSVSVVGPGRTIGSPVDIDAPTALVIQGKDALPFYVWGWCEYDDAFAPETPRRRTEFCYIIKGKLHGLVGLRYISHSTYNAIDQDCQRQPAPRPQKE